MYEYLDKRYAQALYDVAKSKDKVDDYLSDLEMIDGIISNDENFQKIIKHPEITTKEKKKFFINLFKDKIDEDLLTFLLILIEKDRIPYLKEKIAEYKKIDLISKNILKVEITTAVELKEEQRNKLIEKLGKKYNKNIILDETVDKDIIGGIIIKADDELIDGSVRNHINEVKSNLVSKIEVNI